MVGEDPDGVMGRLTRRLSSDVERGALLGDGDIERECSRRAGRPRHANRATRGR